jgi:F-type H+-transporting ATPase subunit epsilon
VQLRIVTPSASLVDAEVREVTSPGIVGEFGVLPGHVTFLGGLDIGVLRYSEADGTVQSLVIEGGYAEVCDDVVTILADAAELGASIDAAEARAEMARLEGEAAKGSEDPATVDETLRALQRAQARVAIAA